MINKLRNFWCRLFGHRFVGGAVLRCQCCKLLLSDLLEGKE